MQVWRQRNNGRTGPCRARSASTFGRCLSPSIDCMFRAIEIGSPHRNACRAIPRPHDHAWPPACACRCNRQHPCNRAQRTHSPARNHGLIALPALVRARGLKKTTHQIQMASSPGAACAGSYGFWYFTACSFCFRANSIGCAEIQAKLAFSACAACVSSYLF